MAQQLLNKVAVVTGAGGGIGRAVVRRFAGEGAKLVLFGRSRAPLEESAALAPARMLLIEGDVSRPEDLQRLAEETVRRFGHVDVLVPSAGFVEAVPIEECSPETAQRQIDINVLAPMETVRRFLPALNSGASVVFLTSALSPRHWPGLAVFHATKAALRALSESLAEELKPRRIRVNTVAPGPTATPFWERLNPRADPTDQRRRPDELIDPDDVAEAVLFLASESATGINGQEIVVEQSN